MKTTFYCSLILTLVCTWVGAQPCREIIGYYPAWQWADRDKLVSPLSLFYQKYTIINYAFLKPAADGSIGLIDPWTDKNLLLGPIKQDVAPRDYATAWDLGNPAYHLPGQRFSDYAHAGGCKFMLSIGGWSLSDLFPQIAAAPDRRAHFARDCRRMVELYGADGIDIDWEYPGYADHNGTPADRENFTLLLRQIRDTLDVLEPMLGRELLLTACFGAAPVQLAEIDWPQVIPLLDLVNLMTYDFHGLWDTTTNHNAPLYALGPHADPGGSIAESAQILLAVHGVPASKLTLGLPFYGRSQQTFGPPGLFVPGKGIADTLTFRDGSAYYNIAVTPRPFDEHWDELARSPYRTGKDRLNTFLSYEDERSIALKAQYIRDCGVRGVIIWEITGDYLERAPGSGKIGATPLIDQINAVFCAKSDQPNPVDDYERFTVLLNPDQTELSIDTDLADAGGEWLIFDVRGKVVQRGIWPGGEQLHLTLTVPDLQPGVYGVALRGGNGGVGVRRWVKG